MNATAGSFGNPEFYLDFINFDPQAKKVFEPHSTPKKFIEETKETKEKKEKKEQAQEVRIDNIHDLVKLSFTEIKNLNVGELKGELFDRVFEETVYPKSLAKSQGQSTKKLSSDKQTIISKHKVPLKYIPPIDYEMPVTPAIPISHALAAHLKLKSLEFQIHYKTNFGNDICILGSCEKLGNWTSSKA